MARINNLTNFLTDVAGAIKTKLDDETSIPASQFDEKILEIETGGVYQEKSITINQNGNMTLLPDTDYDAMSKVSITTDVLGGNPQEKDITITENGTINVLPDSDYDSMTKVSVTVNVSGSEDLSTELDEQDDLIEDIKEALNGKKRK